jgi:phage protein D
MTQSNIPDFRVTLDGKDLTSSIRPLLISLTITEKRGDEADQLDITIDDSTGRVALPPAGAVLSVEIGWKQGSDVTIGLVPKGSFKVDEIEHSGPPDTIAIRASSADFTSDLRVRREKSWHDSTLGAIVGEVARKNGLEPRCAASLASIAVPVVAQSRESDMALLRRLGREYDAVATIKAGKLLFAPIGSGASASGQSLARLTIRRRDGDRHSFRLEKREESEGVVAEYHDRRAAKRKSVTVGKASGARRLSHVYASESSAHRAAKSTMSRAKRAPGSLDISLALGRADVFPEQKASALGFKREIDAMKWIVVSVTHTLSERGFMTALKVESTGG